MVRLHSFFKRRPIQRPAFLVHTLELVNHFAPIWRILEPGKFDVLLYNLDPTQEQIEGPLNGLNLRNVHDVLRTRDRYNVLVSNHPVNLALGNKNREDGIMINQLANTNIRMMYAAGKSRWNMSDWNRHYDGVLCFGPKHAQEFAEQFDLAVCEMGYPRFDKFFNEPADKRSLCDRFGCDPEKPTIVWLPTWKSLSSVDHFNAEVAALLGNYNVVVKVHPLMPDQEPERVRALEKLGLTCLITDQSDNVPLYQLADFMLFDYGGPAFGAIYTGKRFVLLNVPNAAEDALTGENSADLLLRKDFLNIDPGSDQLQTLLRDGPHWEPHENALGKWRKAYFAENFGTSAQVAADAIVNRAWLEEK